MTYRTTYEFTCKEFDSDNAENIEREMMHHNVRVDATDYNLTELLVTIEDFLRASGYDWIAQGALNVKGFLGDVNPDTMTDEDFEEFKTFLSDLNTKSKNKSVEPDPQEMAERLMGIDRTAKIVSIHGGQTNISPIEKEEIIEPSSIHIPEDSISTDSEVSDTEIAYTYSLDFDEDGFPTDFDFDETFSQYQYKFPDQESEIKDKKND